MILTSPSAQIRFSAFNAPSDLASPARRALQESRRRPSGRFIAFPGKISSRFHHGLFRFPFCVSMTGRDRSCDPAIFTARRRRFFFFFFFLDCSRLARLGTRDKIFSQLLTLLSPGLDSHNISLSSATVSFFLPSFLSSFLPVSFPPSLLPSVVSTPLQRMSLHGLSLIVDFFHHARRAKSNQFTCTLEENSQS